jgi:hypothetical protein
MCYVNLPPVDEGCVTHLSKVTPLIDFSVRLSNCLLYTSLLSIIRREIALQLASCVVLCSFQICEIIFDTSFSGSSWSRGELATFE